MGVYSAADHSAVSVVAVIAPRLASGGSARRSWKYCLLVSSRLSARLHGAKSHEVVLVSGAGVVSAHVFDCVYVNADTDTAAPAEIATELRFRFAPLVPTDPSNTGVVPSLFNARNHVAVPVLSADASAVIALAVETPFTDAPKAVAPKRSSARST